MIKNAKNILELIVALFAIIGGFATALIFIKNWHKSNTQKRSKSLTGNWSNEGIIGEPKPSHYIDLALFCSGNKVSGSFNIRKSNEDHTWNKVILNGKRKFLTAKCEIIHIRNGQVLNFGVLLLKLNQKGNLCWIMKNVTSDILPSKAILYRSLPPLI